MQHQNITVLLNNLFFDSLLTFYEQKKLKIIKIEKSVNFSQKLFRLTNKPRIQVKGLITEPLRPHKIYIFD